MLTLGLLPSFLISFSLTISTLTSLLSLSSLLSFLSSLGPFVSVSPPAPQSLAGRLQGGSPLWACLLHLSSSSYLSVYSFPLLSPGPPAAALGFSGRLGARTGLSLSILSFLSLVCPFVSVSLFPPLLFFWVVGVGVSPLGLSSSSLLLFLYICIFFYPCSPLAPAVSLGFSGELGAHAGLSLFPLISLALLLICVGFPLASGPLFFLGWLLLGSPL